VAVYHAVKEIWLAPLKYLRKKRRHKSQYLIRHIPEEDEDYL
jgi:hypothetical protein